MGLTKLALVSLVYDCANKFYEPQSKAQFKLMIDEITNNCGFEEDKPTKAPETSTEKLEETSTKISVETSTYNKETSTWKAVKNVNQSSDVTKFVLCIMFIVMIIACAFIYVKFFKPGHVRFY